MSDSPRIIKKYPNRRLYDTANSGYITLADVKQMILANLAFQVIDAKSGDDITRVILTQIIHEDARQKKGELPLPFLRELIVTSDRAFRDFVSWYADAALSAQRGAKEVFTPLAHALPFLERTLETLRQKAALGATGKPEAQPKTEDIESLKARISDLEAQLAGRRAPRRKAAKTEAPPRRATRRAAR